MAKLAQFKRKHLELSHRILEVMKRITKLFITVTLNVKSTTQGLNNSYTYLQGKGEPYFKIHVLVIRKFSYE